jgi:hypothetical protein
MSFEANQGQSDASVKFLSRGLGYGVFLTSTEAVLVLPNSKIENPESTVLRMRLLGTNTKAETHGVGELPGKTNYFVGADPEKWHKNIPTYAKVHYSNIYPGIDLMYYGQGRQLEYDFVLAPGADPGVIRLDFAGSERLRINQQGDLVVEANGAEIELLKPTVYQRVMGERREVAASYVLDEQRVGFTLGPYDDREPLVIDPVLSYSTYHGAPGSDYGHSIAVDGSGNVYVAGYTTSTNFPTVNPLQPVFGGGHADAFVSKLNAAGSALIYSTFLGGSGLDFGASIAVDGAGNAYMTGYTGSTNFPTVNPLQSATGGGAGDAFVSKLNAAGSALIYSTYLGGGGVDFGEGMAIDSAGNAYVTGETNSTNFPTVHPLQPFKSFEDDAFVSKLNAAGSALVYSTYLGGNRDEGSSQFWGWAGIAVDDLGNAYVTGYTESTNFPTVNPLQPMNGGSGDVYVSKLNAAGSALVYSTYLGGAGSDYGNGIAVDASGNVYVTGSTLSSNFPTANPLQPLRGFQDDAFVSKLNASGSALVYSTYLGGSRQDWANGIAVDAAGNAYVTGYTFSNNFPSVKPLQPANGLLEDAFVSKLNAAGSALVYSTHLGGNNRDAGYSIAVDGSGNAYVTGSTASGNFPTVNPLQPAFAGGIGDAFITRISDSDAAPPTVNSIRPRSGSPGTTVNVALSGSNFMGGSTIVMVSGSGLTVGPVNVGSSTSLTATITIAASALPGVRDVKVITPGGTTVDGVAFTVGPDLFPNDN